MQRDCSEYAIDIGKIVRERSGKDTPRFLVRWMERFIHQDFINGFLTQGYEGTEFCRECLEYLDVKIDVRGLENLDVAIRDNANVLNMSENGKTVSRLAGGAAGRARLTFASNHPLGGVDGIALLGVISERTGKPVRLLVNDFLMNIKPIAPLSVPVNKMGGQSRSLPAQVRAIYESDDDILVFPAGKCSRKMNGHIQDTAWSKSFVSQSVATGRWIIPVRFTEHRERDRTAEGNRLQDGGSQLRPLNEPGQVRHDGQPLQAADSLG